MYCQAAADMICIDIRVWQYKTNVVRHICPLTFDLVTPKSIGEICDEWYLRLSAETNRPTLAKQYTPSSSKGGITIHH